MKSKNLADECGQSARFGAKRAYVEDYEQDDEEPDPVKKIKTEAKHIPERNKTAAPASSSMHHDMQHVFPPGEEVLTEILKSTESTTTSSKQPDKAVSALHATASTERDSDKRIAPPSHAVPAASSLITPEIRELLEGQLTKTMQMLDSRTDALVEAKCEEKKAEWIAQAKAEMMAQDGGTDARERALSLREKAQEDWAKTAEKARSNQAIIEAHREKKRLADWDKENQQKKKLADWGKDNQQKTRPIVQAISLAQREKNVQAKEQAADAREKEIVALQETYFRQKRELAEQAELTEKLKARAERRRESEVLGSKMTKSLQSSAPKQRKLARLASGAPETPTKDEEATLPLCKKRGAAQSRRRGT